MFSVADEEEARNLLVLSCERGLGGQFIARELAVEQTLENLDAFSHRLAVMHDHLKTSGRCRCTT